MGRQSFDETQVLDVLLHALRRDVAIEARVLERLDGETLLVASQRHGIDHVVLDWFASVCPDHPAVGTLVQRNRTAAAFNLRVLGALRGALGALPADLPVLALKGPVLASFASTTGVRPYGDLDLLVPPDRLSDALDALHAWGATPFPYGSWREAFETEHAQVPMRLPFGVHLDLHWHLCSQPHIRNAFSVDSAQVLLARAERLDLSNGVGTGIGDIPVFERHDMLIHTAAHAGWSGGDRFGWLVDVDSVIRSHEIDWDAVMGRSESWGLASLVADILRRTRRTLLTEIPTDVLRWGGSRRSVSTALRIADRLAPARAVLDDRSIARFARLATRDSLTSTLGVMAARYAQALGRRVGPPNRATAPRPPTGPDDEQWKEQYLALTARQGQG